MDLVIRKRLGGVGFFVGSRGLQGRECWFFWGGFFYFLFERKLWQFFNLVSNVEDYLSS